MKKLADNSKDCFNVFWINFFSVFNPVYFCTFTAICFFRENPVLSRQSYNVLMVAAMYALPWLFSSALTKYFLGKFSSRGVVVYCKLAEVAVALMAVIFSLFTGKTGYLPLFAGFHDFSHRCFAPKNPYQISLAFCNLLIFQSRLCRSG